MKVRSSFVSNSSSSSFVVGITKDTSTKVTLQIEIDLQDFADYTIKNMQDLNDYMQEEMYVGDYVYEDWDSFEQDMYDSIKKLIEKGKIVILGTVSDENDATEAMLCRNGFGNSIDKDSGIEVIQDCDGY